MGEDVRSQDLTNGQVHATDEQVTDAALRETSLQVYPAGCVVVAMYGGFRQFGRTGLLAIPAAVNQALTAIRTDQQRLVPGYLLSILNHRVSYWRSVASSSRRDPNITGRDVAAFPIACPPKFEQELITQTLADADALIQSLEQLLAKKRQIKQGAMHDLLTGERRLPGFDAKPGFTRTEIGLLRTDWDAVPFGRSIRKIEAGVSVNSEKDTPADFQNHPCVLKTGAAQSGTLRPDESKKVAARDLLRLRVSLRRGTILVSRMNTGELVGENAYVDADYPMLFVPDRMWMITVGPSNLFHARWLSCVLTWPRVRRQISAAATGTSGSMKNISKSLLRAIVIPCPSEREQAAIASVLMDMDAEIAVSEARLAKARALKQGMMQELLTGRIRLVPPVDRAADAPVHLVQAT